jgi:O-antigen/teichoic acid export membrane protein
MVIGLVALPYLLSNIGIERLGVLTLIWTLIGYFSIFDFGLGRALTHQVSNLRAHEKHEKILATIKTGLLLMSGFGFFGAAIVAVITYSGGLNWLNLSPKIYLETYSAILIAVIGVPFTILTSGFKGVLEGFEKFQEVNILKSILGIANFGLPVLTVYFFNSSLSSIVLGLVIARVVVFLMHVQLTNKSIPLAQIISLDSSEGSANLLKFGAWMTLSNIISPLMVVADRFIISHYVGAAAIAFYTVPFDFLLRLLILPAALTTTLFPRVSYHFSTDKEQAKRLYFKSLKTIAVIMLPTCLLISVFSYWGLDLWMGSNFSKNSYLVASIIAIGIFFNSIAQVPHMMLQASGDVKRTSLIHLVEFLVYAPVLVFAVIKFGLIGAACSWLLRVIIDYLFLQAFAMQKFGDMKVNSNAV